MKLFFDSNIFLRYLVPENPKSYENCTKLIELAESGEITPYISNVVVQEIIYILQKMYKFNKKRIFNWLAQLIHLRNLVIIEKTNTRSAINRFKTLNIKFGDCLIATQIPKGVTLCTYDTEFQKIPGLLTATPETILKQFQHN